MKRSKNHKEKIEKNALTDPERVCTPSVMEYWKPLAEDMDASAGIEAEYHHKNYRVYCWKGLRFSAKHDLEGFSRFTEFGVEGVVPPELLPPEISSKYQSKPSEKKRAKKELVPQADDNQMTTPATDIDGGGGISNELEDSATPMDADGGAVNISHSGAPSPDENQKLSRQGSQRQKLKRNRRQGLLMVRQI